MVTLKQIAKRLNVSTATVSHVLNRPAGNTRVSQAKRELIQRVAREMGYVPNVRAQSLVKRRAQCVGFLCSRSYARNNHKSDAYFHAILEGVEEACRDAGYHCLYARYEPEELARIVGPKFTRDGSVDGIILAGYTPPEAIRTLVSLRIPCFQVGTNVHPGTGIRCFTSDLANAFERTVRRLRELGHRRVQLVLPGGPGPEAWARRFMDLRYTVPGLEPEVAWMTMLSSNRESALAHIRAVCQRADRPTAFICNPVHLEGLWQGMAEAGWTCPRDYSVVCFGQLGPEEEPRLYPAGVALSFIVLPVREAGRRAAQALLEHLEAPGGEAEAREQDSITTYIPCDVVFRESCGPCGSPST